MYPVAYASLLLKGGMILIPGLLLVLVLGYAFWRE